MASKFFSEKDKSNITWFWRRYLKRKTPWLGLILAMVLLEGFVLQKFLAITETGLRVIFEQGDTMDLLWICLVVFLIFMVRALVSFVVPTLSVRLASGAVLELRSDLIRHVLYMDQRFFDRTNASDLILRFVNQVEALSQFVGRTTVEAVRDVATIVIISGYLIYKSALLFGVALLLLPIIFLLMRMVSETIKRIQAQSEQALGSYMNTIEEMSGGMRTIKMTGQEAAEVDRMISESGNIKKLAVNLHMAQALVLPSIDLSSAIVYMVVIGGGGYLALSEASTLDGASIIAFLLGLVIVFDPARRLSQFFTKLQTSLILLASVRGVLQTQPDVSDEGTASDFTDMRIDITLDDIGFSYEADHKLFDGISLQFKAGQKTAIVGSTGSGKTTLLSLMARLYDLNSGAVLFNGKDIKQFTLKSVREKFSIVAQDVVIFNKSIAQNIQYADPTASAEAVRAAAKLARIDDLMIERGDQPVGPKGRLLSGGQKQRIAIARAFLKPAPILLLDEATSALDALTEQKVNASFKDLQAGKTTIVVAHKFSSVVDADHIYVLEAGKLVEQGTHADLMAKAGLYASMFSAQDDILISG
ncbi:MAG: ABC transporter ATP-binding protein [Rhodobacteraceae bacterium]|nr:ABC transporter ATP-binding protein [Paracoccaceae bacterium]MBL6640529.1 ABC transporter ATP-binding protein [Paracoccaceae bacterium]MBL6676389.1 ABC transporter ATP-binding protein [Paracoccaceae bacterium]MBL6788654.1 ABC transporter ATP-binding protein [Paracoccaceae bacterium]MBL6859469.1 ABC transporter ATP-binding protein [Paracoccaceae bacterium]